MWVDFASVLIIYGHTSGTYVCDSGTTIRCVCVWKHAQVFIIWKSSTQKGRMYSTLLFCAQHGLYWQCSYFYLILHSSASTQQLFGLCGIGKPWGFGSRRTVQRLIGIILAVLIRRHDHHWFWSGMTQSSRAKKNKSKTKLTHGKDDDCQADWS